MHTFNWNAQYFTINQILSAKCVQIHLLDLIFSWKLSCTADTHSLYMTLLCTQSLLSTKLVSINHHLYIYFTARFTPNKPDKTSNNKPYKTGKKNLRTPERANFRRREKQPDKTWYNKPDKTWNNTPYKTWKHKPYKMWKNIPAKTCSEKHSITSSEHSSE